MKPSSLRILHRRLGIVFCFFTLLASSSGVLHNIMSATQEAPPKTESKSDPLPLEDVKLSPAEAARRLPAGSPPPTALNLRVIGGEPWYAFRAPGQDVPIYVHAGTGVIDPAVDARFAREIAQRHLGSGEPLPAGRLTKFDAEYIAIFRILPVYRFNLHDGPGTRVYVSTLTESVTRETNDVKQFEANVFSLFHKFAFIPDRTARNGLLTATTTGIALTALVGIALYLLPRKNRISER